MKEQKKFWWLVLLKGIILVILAFFVFQHPISALVGLTLYIGVSLLFTGVFLVITALSIRNDSETWRWRLAEGIIDTLFAIVLLSNPALTAAVFPFIVGFWIIIYGAMMFVDSFKVKKEGSPTWWTVMLSGLLAMVIGYFITSNILVGAIAITVWIGIGFLIFGLINISLSMRMKKGIPDVST